MSLFGKVWNKVKKAPKKFWIVGAFLGAIKKTLAFITSPSKKTAIEFLKAWARILVTPQKQIHDIVMRIINTQMPLAYWFMNILFLAGFSILTYLFIIVIKKTIQGTLQWIRMEAPKPVREGPAWIWTFIVYWCVYLISYSLLWSWPNWPTVPTPNLWMGLLNWITFPFQGWRLMILAFPAIFKPLYDVLPTKWLKGVYTWLNYTKKFGLNKTAEQIMGISKEKILSSG